MRFVHLMMCFPIAVLLMYACGSWMSKDWSLRLFGVPAAHLRMHELMQCFLRSTRNDSLKSGTISPKSVIQSMRLADLVCTRFHRHQVTATWLPCRTR